MTKPAHDWERDWELSESLTDWGNWYSVEDIAKHVRKVNEAQAAMQYWLQRVRELEDALRQCVEALEFCSHKELCKMTVGPYDLIDYAKHVGRWK